MKPIAETFFECMSKPQPDYTEEYKKADANEAKTCWPMVVGTRQLGYFDVSHHAIVEDPDKVQKVLSEFLIVECSYRFDADCMRYLAYHPRFCATPIGHMAMNYDVLGGNF